MTDGFRKVEADTASLAVMIGIPSHTIRNWARRGHIQPLRAEGTRTIYDAEAVAKVATRFGYLPDLRTLQARDCVLHGCKSTAWDDMDVPLCPKHAIAVWLRVEDEWKSRIPPSDLPPSSRDPVVYFIKIGDLIKIGTTITLPGRLAAFRTDNGNDLEILLVVPGGRTEEKQAHALFAAERVRGEWFRPSQRLLGFIAERQDQDVRHAQTPLLAQ